jgi:hypothetical protein
LSTSIRAGGLLVLDPSDKRVIQFDWDAEALASGVEISTKTITITPIQQADAAADLTSDNESLVSGNRKVQVRLLATTATVGDSYWVACKVVTNETPAQEIEQRIKVLIQDQ